MTLKELEDRILESWPFVWPNNRGSFSANGRYQVYGLPPPPRNRKEGEDELKGGDFIGIEPGTGKFVSIEAKTKNDRLKLGQKKWHNFILSKGGISEIWHEQEDGSIKIYKEPFYGKEGT